MWEYWYSGVLVRMNAGLLVLGWEYWYSLPILTYAEVDHLSWGGRRHPDSQGTPLLSLLENNHRNIAFFGSNRCDYQDERHRCVTPTLISRSLSFLFLTMSDWGGRGRSGRGGRTGRGPGGGRGNAYTSGRVKTTKVGLCRDLEGNVFDFRTTSVADQMRITQEKIAQYIGAKYGEDIANKLQNKLRIVLSAPAYPSTMMT
jgi:hypothetical protein